MQRRDFLTSMLAGAAILRLRSARAQETPREIVLERAAADTPHKGKVLLAVQAHSDDIPLKAADTVAKLVKNPDHQMIARGVEASCWMAGRDHDYPEQFAAGLKPHAVQEKYYYARRPEITRVVDITSALDQKVEANRATQAKGPGGRHGSRLRAELAAKNQRLPLLGDDDATADRSFIKEFVLARNRELGRKFGVEYAEAFHYIGPAPSRAVDDYVRQNAVPLK